MNSKLEKSKIYPLLGILLSVALIVFSLVRCYDFNTLYFLAAVYVLFCLFGMFLEAIKILPFAFVSVSVFAGLTYLIGRNIDSTVAMVNRLLGLSIAVIPGLSIRAIDLTRDLNHIHVPRPITLGMMICLSFVPLLHGEIRQIRQAMKTRGASSLIHPRIFYRAFLIPLVMRLVNISDTLSLSVEARGFSMDGKQYSVYHYVPLSAKDVIFVTLIVVGMVLVVVL